MHKLTVLYRQPDDPEGFDREYESVHLPIVRRYPGIRELRITRYARDPRGNPPAYALAAEMLFDDEAALDAALASEAGRESGKDFGRMSKEFGVQADFLVGSEDAAS